MKKYLRLPMDYYQDLWKKLEDYEFILSRAATDISRELQGNKIIFAVDFSEVYNYLYSTRSDATRGLVNSFIFDNSPLKWTLFPAAVGELIESISGLIPKVFRIDYDNLLANNPKIKNFLRDNDEILKNKEKFLDYYINADNEIRNFLSTLIITLGDVNRMPPAINKLIALLSQQKLSPIENISRIGTLNDEDNYLFNFIFNFLMYKKKTYSKNNRADAIDSMLINKLNLLTAPDEFVAFYTQAENLIGAFSALRSNQSFSWGDNGVLRDTKYFIFRTNLKTKFEDDAECLEKIRYWRTLCKEMKTEISQTFDIEKKLEGGAIKASYLLMNKYRIFCEDCEPIMEFHRADVELKKQAEELYKIWLEQNQYKGDQDQTIELLKVHLKSIITKLQLFTPIQIDDQDVKKYMKEINRWLGINEDKLVR